MALGVLIAVEVLLLWSLREQSKRIFVSDTYMCTHTFTSIFSISVSIENHEFMPIYFILVYHRVHSVFSRYRSVTPFPDSKNPAPISLSTCTYLISRSPYCVYPVLLPNPPLHSRGSWPPSYSPLLLPAPSCRPPHLSGAPPTKPQLPSSKDTASSCRAVTSHAEPFAQLPHRCLNVQWSHLFLI